MKEDNEKKNQNDEEITVTDAEDDEETVEVLSTETLLKQRDDAQKEAEAQRKRADEMTDMAKRLQAEFDNYRKRTLDNGRKAREDATAEVIKKLVSVLDVVGQALTMITDENIASGVRMIESSMVKLLGEYGVTEIEALGKEFDPKVHEAIMQTPAESDEQKDTVKEVFQKGYVMGDRVIRPARVIVNK